MHNPWKKESTRKIYDNPWISLYEDQVINPSGGAGIYGRVLFKNYAIGIIPVDDEGNTYLVGQYRYPLDEYSWEIPMGGGPLTDDKLFSAKRELAEETGLKAKKWEEIMRIHTSNAVTNETGFIYLATGLTKGESTPEDTEELRVWKLPLQEAIDMALNNKITDSISVAGLLKVGMMTSQMGDG